MSPIHLVWTAAVHTLTFHHSAKLACRKKAEHYMQQRSRMLCCPWHDTPTRTGPSGEGGHRPKCTPQGTTALSSAPCLHQKWGCAMSHPTKAMCQKNKRFFPWTLLQGSRGQRYSPAQRDISNFCSQTCADQLHVVTQIQSLQRELVAAAKTAAGHPPLEALPARALIQCLSWGFGIWWSPPDKRQPGPFQVSPHFPWGPAISSQFEVLLNSSSGSPAANWLMLGCTELTPPTKSSLGENYPAR